MRIAFYASNIVPVHAGSLSERPLGGTEAGLIYLADALQQLGHEVFVFTPHENPPASKPVYYSHKRIESCPPLDVFIAVRDWIPLLFRVSAKQRMLWTGDSYDQFSNFGLGDKRVEKRLDVLLAVSEWQADRLCEMSGFDRKKAWVIRNGVQLALFEGSEKREPKRLIYSSTPHRGLRHVPELMRKLREKHSDVECHIFSSYKVYDQEGVRSFEELRKELLATPGCVLHESILQKNLAREFMKSRVLFYPCDYEETSCITAMEAQAAGCAILSTALAALPETVGPAGILLPAGAGTPAYNETFISECDRLLRDEAYFEKFSLAGKERARNMSWERVGKRFEEFLMSRL